MISQQQHYIKDCGRYNNHKTISMKKSNFTISNPIPGVCCVTFDTQYLLASSFMRLQEFYESPYRAIRNKYFTREEYEDLYAQHNGNFTYYQDWAGFNIPITSVQRFLALFSRDLNTKESKLFNAIFYNLYHNDIRYLIGVVYGDKTSLNHELAHALYNTNGDYYKAMKKLVASTKIPQLRGKLIQLGYCKSQIHDEVQAYLATMTPSQLKKWKIEQSLCIKFRKVFHQYAKPE